MCSEKMDELQTELEIVKNLSETDESKLKRIEDLCRKLHKEIDHEWSEIKKLTHEVIDKVKEKAS
jgi:hypothetical protein